MRGLVMLAVLTSMGCATIIKGSNADLTVVTQPPGATVYIDGFPVGPSPWAGEVKQDAHQIRAELAGYQPGFARVTASFSGWTLLGGLLGIVIDAVTGAITTTDQDQVMIVLQPAANPAPSGLPPSPQARAYPAVRRQ
jgi:hypothetical protein